MGVEVCGACLVGLAGNSRLQSQSLLARQESRGWRPSNHETKLSFNRIHLRLHHVSMRGIVLLDFIGFREVACFDGIGNTMEFGVDLV